MRKILIIILTSCFLVNIHAQSEYKFIESLGDSIYYEVAGKGENTVLFLAGGPGAPPESLKPIVDYVSKNHKTILLHQQGTGLSSNCKIDSVSTTINQYVEDINSVLAKENVERVFIIGHSWGAMLGLDFMTKYPTEVQGLILIGSSGYALDFVPSMNNEIFSRMTPSEMDSLKVYFGQLNSIKEPALANDIQNKVSTLVLSKQFYDSSLVDAFLSLGSINMKVNMTMMNDLMMKGWNLQEDLEKLDNPVVIINGNYDPIGKEYVQDLKHSLRNCDLHFIDDCGHYVWVEKPRELQDIVEGFLSNH